MTSLKLKISSNESISKPHLAQILSYYNESDYEFCKLDIGDLQKGRTSLELKFSAEDFLSSLSTEGTTSRLYRQAQNLSLFPVSEIIVFATLPEVILAAKRPIPNKENPLEPHKTWSIKSIIGICASIRSRFNVPINFIGAMGAPYYIYDVLEKSNDGKVPLINPLKISATPKQEQEALLQSIKDIGPKTASILLSHFKTAQNIFNASQSDLEKIKGIGPETSKIIYEISRRNYDTK